MKNKKLQSLAIAFFKANPDQDEVYITSDGQVFLTVNSANLHKNFNSKGKKLGVQTFKAGSKTDTSSEEFNNPVADLNVKDAAAFIASIETVEELDAIADADERKGVADAVIAKKQELTNTED